MNLEPAIATDAAWIGAILQMGDTFYPTGAYAHSFGLEGLIEEGVIRDRTSLAQFLTHSVIPALRHTELPLVAENGRALAENDWGRIARLGHLGAALRTAKEARTASEAIGRQRIELLVTLRGFEAAREALRRAAEEGWPLSTALAAAVESKAVGAPLVAAMTGVFYSTVAGTLAAAMKLLRLGQNGSQTLLTELMGQAPGTLAAALQVPEAEIGWFNPWLDIAAARHEHAPARLFIS